MIGVSLATAMTIMGVMVSVNVMKRSTAIGQTDAGVAFAIVPLGGILFFAVVFALAVANTRRPEIHKRLMLLAAISILECRSRALVPDLSVAAWTGRPAARVSHRRAGASCLSAARDRDLS